jgi:hypothetical protein
MKRPSILLVWLTLLVGVLLAVRPAAQAQPTDELQLTPPQLVSDMLMRFAMRALADSGPDGLRDDQTARADILLDLAAELTPDEPAVWEMQINLARQTGDQASLQAALARYLELRPEDDAYRLEWITSRVGEVETLDGRLALLEDHLARSGEPGYTQPLRSRLASTAAALALELGQNDTYLKHLKTAVRADPTNGDAAQLTYDLALRRDAAPVQRAAAAMNLVRARPTSSDDRITLARALADLALFERAAEQFQVATRLPRQGPIDEASLTVWSRCLIASGDRRQAQRLLDEVEAVYRQPAEEGGEPRPVPVELHLHRRILLGEAPEGSAAYDQLVQRLEADAAAGNADATLELAWIKALFADDTDEVTALLEGQPQSDPRYQRATGFVFMREGAERWARSSFEPIAEQDAIAAYGLALLRGRDDAGKARFLRDVVQRFPDRIGGLLAASQLQEMNREVSPGPTGAVIVDAMNRMPPTFWRYDVQRNPWVTVRAQFDAARSGYLEPINAQLTLANALDLPLAIDPATAVDRTSVVSIAAYMGGQLIGQMPPVVIEASRRLVLPARAKMTVPARIDRSLFGFFLAKSASSTITYNTAFSFGPRFLPDGGMVLGPLGGIDTVRSVQAFLPPYQPNNLEQWATRATDGRGGERFRALALLARLGESLVGSEADPALVRRCIDAVNQSFTDSDRLTRAWVLMMLPPLEGRRSEYQESLELAQRQDDPLVQVAFLASQATEPDHPALAAAIRDGSPPVRRYAEALREALSQPAPQAPDAPARP